MSIFHQALISWHYPCAAGNKRSPCCRLVSVRLSRWWIVRIHMAEETVKLLVLPSKPMILVTPCANTQFLQGEPHHWECKIHGGGIIFAVYLGNGAIYAHDYYWTSIGSHRWQIDPCQFRWPWVTFDPDFKVTTFFEVNYLKMVHFRNKVTIEH